MFAGVTSGVIANDSRDPALSARFVTRRPPGTDLQPGGPDARRHIQMLSTPATIAPITLMVDEIGLPPISTAV
jgi:hypothetical protein